MSNILAFESSCDDTSVAVLDTSYRIMANLISSQPQHLEFGGVLPELASRLHMKNILHLCDLALLKAGLSLQDIEAVAVSINPGLIGSLIVGLSFAKSLAWARSIPLITVNHLLSHIFANYIDHPDIEAPFMALVVSGGHTEMIHFKSETEFKVLGKTLDDAAGETFDKAAKLMGLGFPGGPILDKLSINGDPDFYRFPRALPKKDDYNFSYSGVKTAIRSYLQGQTAEYIKSHESDLAASIQAAIVEPLVQKTIRKAKELKLKRILLAGGVAANSRLRSEMEDKAGKIGITVYYPSLQLCMDNAAMVGAAAIPKYKAGLISPLDVNAFSQKGTKLL